MRISSKVGLLTVVLLGIVVFLFGSESTSAITTIRDGGATEANGFRASPNQGGSTHARDVDPSVSRVWERNQIQRGGKAPLSRFNARNGNNLIYDTYKKD